MKNSILEKSFNEIFTKNRLLFELSKLKPIPYNIEEIKQEIEKDIFFESSPKQSFFIPKSDGTFRQITLPSVKTKIIQKVLANELNAVMHYNDKSYAFRQGKSPIKAINRVKDFLKRYQHIAKADIEDFFDSISQDILLKKLQKIIKDKKIIHLISYQLSMGMLYKNRWIDKTKGVYQGDVLSPSLSNIYLNDFDFYLEQKGIDFVRYADDLIFFAKSKKEVSKNRAIALEYLDKLNLHFNKEKTYISDINNGFEYLGIYFKNNQLKIDNAKLAKKLKSLEDDTKKLNLKDTVTKINEKVDGFLNYYAKIIDDSYAYEQLQNKLEEIIVKKIVTAKSQKTINSKKEFLKILTPLKSYINQEQNRFITNLIELAYTELKYSTPIKSAKKDIANTKVNFLKKQIKSTELVVSQVGAFLSFSQGKVKVKQKGKIILEAPINRVQRILLLNKQSSISTYLIYECAKRKIDIDFIHHQKPYALISYYQHVSPKLHLEQIKLYFSPRGFEIAKEITKTKAKNQINLLKYYNRRHKDIAIVDKIEKMQNLYKKIDKAKNKESLMGIEGNISSQYWYAFGLIIGITGFIRTHKDSKDAINQALNYGYAIIYNRVQSALIHEGLNIYYSLYHAMQKNKPTLVFDMVEEFRQPIVDREIISILNKNQKITQNSGKLTQKSIKLIVQNIQERLATPTKSRYGKTPLYNIIYNQTNHLKHSILSKSTYKGFVNKY